MCDARADSLQNAPKPEEHRSTEARIYRATGSARSHGRVSQKRFPFFSPSSSFLTCQAHLFTRGGVVQRCKKKTKQQPQKSCEKVTREGKLGLGQQVGPPPLPPPSSTGMFTTGVVGVLVPWLDNQRAAGTAPDLRDQRYFAAAAAAGDVSGLRPNASPTTENVTNPQLKLLSFLYSVLRVILSWHARLLSNASSQRVIKPGHHHKQQTAEGTAAGSIICFDCSFSS